MRQVNENVVEKNACAFYLYKTIERLAVRQFYITRDKIDWPVADLF